MPKADYSPIKSVAFRGGIDTRRDRSQLPFGAYSQVQNWRPRRPGLIKRPGCIVLHTTNDSTNGVHSMYHFKKQRVANEHLFAFMTDADILKATALPPTVTTGAFGSQIESLTSSQTGENPGSWATVRDLCCFAYGGDWGQIYSGALSFVEGAVVYKEAATPTDIPEGGADYSEQVQYIFASGTSIKYDVVDLDDVGSDGDHYLALCTPVPVNSFYVTMGDSLNSNTVTISSVNYRKNDNTWAAVAGLDDGTETGGDTTLGQSGTIAFTAPTNQVDNYMHGRNGFWYKIHFSGVLDSSVYVDAISYSTTGFVDMINKWDAVTLDPVEVWAAVTAADEWSVFSATSVDLGDLPASRTIYLMCTDLIESIYVDVGATPNSGGATIASLKYWDGSAFTTVGTFTDGTTGFQNSGWITFPRKTAFPHAFQGCKYNAYVYEITTSATALSTDMNVGFEVRPYFDIDQLGPANCVSSWRDRACWSFNVAPQWVYISAKGDPQILNGVDSGALEAGDGRYNKVLAMTQFYNEQLVWQKESGTDGGCTTLFQGYSPTTFGKLLLSNRIGIMNSKSYSVVDGVKVSTETDEQIKTIAYWLSRYGVMATDGRVVTAISDEIQNYFDPTNSNSIRRGYEDEHWMGYDSAFNILRIGLVTGTTATKPNTFLVYDLADRVWYTDTLAQEFSCFLEMEAGSAAATVLQIAGGTNDGFIYLTNSGQNDVTTAVNSSLRLEIDGEGEVMNLHELLLDCKVQTAGDILLTIEENDIAKVTDKTLSMITEVAGHMARRHRFHLNIIDDHISITLAHNTASQDVYLYSMGVLTTLWKRK